MKIVIILVNILSTLPFCSSKKEKTLQSIENSVSYTIDSIMRLKYSYYVPLNKFYINYEFFMHHNVTKEKIEFYIKQIDTVCQLLEPIYDTANLYHIRNLNFLHFFRKLDSCNNCLDIRNCYLLDELNYIIFSLTERNDISGKDALIEKLQIIMKRLENLKLYSVLLEYGYLNKMNDGNLVFIEFKYLDSDKEYAVYNKKNFNIIICNFD